MKLRRCETQYTSFVYLQRGAAQPRFVTPLPRDGKRDTAETEQAMVRWESDGGVVRAVEVRAKLSEPSS